MLIKFKIITWAAVISMFVTLSVFAAEMDHSMHKNMDHEKMDHSNMGHGNMDHGKMDHGKMHQADKPKPVVAKGVLSKMPLTGKAREMGYNGTIFYARTGKESTRDDCAAASNGLIMVDNAAWAKCGGRPEGWSTGPGGDARDATPMDHSKMGH